MRPADQDQHCFKMGIQNFEEIMHIKQVLGKIWYNRSYLLHSPNMACLLVSFDSLSHSQRFFSHVGMGLPGLNQ